jgi:hypothetical protein
MDELGLLCAECGRCPTATFKREAEGLGYVVLISEGTAAVLAMVQSGKVEAFVGASCMSTLREVFPIVSLVGVPAVAIPLLCDGCENTGVDADWLLDAIRSGAGQRAPRPAPAGETGPGTEDGIHRDAGTPRRRDCMGFPGALGGLVSWWRLSPTARPSPAVCGTGILPVPLDRLEACPTGGGD